MAAIFFIILGAFISYVLIFTRRHLSNSTDLVPRTANWWGISAGLFTLVGGGEIITLSSMGFTFGWSALSLFLGYAIAFAFLGFAISRDAGPIEDGSISLSDRLSTAYGPVVGWSAFLISFAAFFALLVLQFTVGGSLLSKLLGLPYWLMIVALAASTAFYLIMGRYQAVLETDKIQGIAMLTLGVLMLIVLSLTLGDAGKSYLGFISSGDPMPMNLLVSLSITGFFVAAASADVWQRMLAAKNTRARKLGGTIGACGLMWQGVVFTAVGVVARNVLGPTANPDGLIGELVTRQFGTIGIILTVCLVTCAVLSTADTEVFLLSSMLEKARNKSSAISPRFNIFLVSVASLSAVFAIFVADAIEVYTWILMLIVTVAPLTLISLFRRLNKTIASISILSALVIVMGLKQIGVLDLNNLYLVPVGFSLVLVVFSTKRN